MRRNGETEEQWLTIEKSSLCWQISDLIRVFRKGSLLALEMFAIGSDLWSQDIFTEMQCYSSMICDMHYSWDMCKLQTCEIYVIDLKLDMSTRRLQTLRLASNGPFGAPTLYNIKEYNNLILEAIRRPLHLQISSCEILALWKIDQIFFTFAPQSNKTNLT